MPTVSVVIVTKNEEKHIGELLAQLNWADEIIVVDMFSTDRTVEIARLYTDKIFQHDSFRETGSLVPEPIAVNKNLGFEKASGDWILELDADERPSPELVAEIKTILASDDVPYDGFMIPYRVYFFGYQVRYGGWQNDRHIRFFRRGVARWQTERVHQPHEFSGRLGYLRHPILHYMCDSLSHFIRKMEFYTSQEVEFYFKSGRPFRLRNLVFGVPRQFCKRYFLLQGFRDGLPGLIVCGAYTCYSFFVHAKLWELWQKKAAQGGVKS